MRRILLLPAVVVGVLIVGSATALGAAARSAASPPVNTSPPTISGTVRQDQTLTASSGSWSGLTPIAYAYRWQSCGSDGSNCKNIGGATSQTYVATHGDVGHALRVSVTASNSDGSSQALSGPTGAIANLGSAPANTSQPNPSGTPQDGQTVSVNNGTWSGAAPITFSYQWQTCTVVNPVCVNLPGMTGQTFLIGTTQVGSLLRATVTASNAAGKTSTFSNLTTAVLAKLAAPLNTVLPSISGNASVGQRLTASTGVWTGVPTNGYVYQWTRCNSSGSSCSNVSGATGQTYGVGAVDVGMSLRVNVTATNTSGSTVSTSKSLSIPRIPVVAARLNAVIRSDQEVVRPKGVSTRAAAHFTGKVTGKTLSWTLTYAGIDRPTSVSLNTGARGVNWNAFKTLCVRCAASLHGTLTVTAAQLDSLKAGRAYVNVHTTRNPYGAIRGQITA